MLHIISGELLKKATACLVVPVCEDKEIHDDPSIINLIQQTETVKEFKDASSVFRPESSLLIAVSIHGLGATPPKASLAFFIILPSVSRTAATLTTAKSQDARSLNLM